MQHNITSCYKESLEILGDFSGRDGRRIRQITLWKTGGKNNKLKGAKELALSPRLRWSYGVDDSMSNRLQRSRSRRSLVICVVNNKPSAKHVRLSAKVIVTEQSATFSALAWAKIKNRQEDRMSRILYRSLNR